MTATTLAASAEEDVRQEYRSWARAAHETASIEAAKRRKLAAAYRAIRGTLSIAGALLAAAAGATALPADVAAWVTPTLAFLAAAVTGLTAALHPSKQAHQHCKDAAD